MAAAKQQHQQHMADTTSQLQEASEAAQQAQAAEAEATNAAEQIVTAVQSDRAVATAAAQQAEDAVRRFAEGLLHAKRDSMAILKQHEEKLKQFVLAVVGKAIPAAMQQISSDWKGLQETAKEARSILQGVSHEISSKIESSMQTACYSIQHNLAKIVDCAIADVRKSHSPNQVCA